MMAKPMKTLELHYPMIQFLIMADSVHWLSQSDYSTCISVLVEFY